MTGNLQKKRCQVITPLIDRDIAWTIFLEIAKSYDPKFKIDRDNSEAYKQMFLYFLRDSEFNGNLKGGLFLVGQYGSGKNMAFEIFRYFVRYLNDNNELYSITYETVETLKIISEFHREKKGGESAIAKYKSKDTWVFNDLGKEMKLGLSAYRYGRKVNLMQVILSERYDLFTTSGVITHATSNSQFKNNDGILVKHYGAELFDRFPEMFTQIYFKGESRRPRT